MYKSMMNFMEYGKAIKNKKRLAIHTYMCTYILLL